MHMLHNIPIEQVAAEYYLFELGQTIDKTAEILELDEEFVRKVHGDYQRFIMAGRSTQ